MVDSNTVANVSEEDVGPQIYIHSTLEHSQSDIREYQSATYPQDDQPSHLLGDSTEASGDLSFSLIGNPEVHSLHSSDEEDLPLGTFRDPRRYGITLRHIPYNCGIIQLSLNTPGNTPVRVRLFNFHIEYTGMTFSQYTCTQIIRFGLKTDFYVDPVPEMLGIYENLPNGYMKCVDLDPHTLYQIFIGGIVGEQIVTQEEVLGMLSKLAQNGLVPHASEFFTYNMWSWYARNYKLFLCNYMTSPLEIEEISRQYLCQSLFYTNKASLYQAGFSHGRIYLAQYLSICASKSRLLSTQLFTLKNGEMMEYFFGEEWKTSWLSSVKLQNFIGGVISAFFAGMIPTLAVSLVWHKKDEEKSQQSTEIAKRNLVYTKLQEFFDFLVGQHSVEEYNAFVHILNLSESDLDMLFHQLHILPLSDETLLRFNVFFSEDHSSLEVFSFLHKNEISYSQALYYVYKGYTSSEVVHIQPRSESQKVFTVTETYTHESLIATKTSLSVVTNTVTETFTADGFTSVVIVPETTTATVVDLSTTTLVSSQATQVTASIFDAKYEEADLFMYILFIVFSVLILVVITFLVGRCIYSCCCAKKRDPYKDRAYMIFGNNSGGVGKRD